MKTKKEILDYVISRKEYYEKERNWALEKLSNANVNSNDYKVYDWITGEYESRLEVINDLLYFIYEEK